MDAIWFLVGQTDENEKIRYIPVHSTPFRIGRRGDVSFSICSQTVSGVHAEIVQVGKTLALRDLDSTKGTYVNGRRVTEQVTLNENDLVQLADVAFRVRRQEAAVEAGTIQTNGYDRALALVQFDNLMTDRAVIPHFQPIVELEGQRPLGYEVLARSQLVGLETPGAMFTAAAQLNLEVELSRMIRWEGIQDCTVFPDRPKLFVNTHPSELVAGGLLESMRALREFRPDQPITLEIHEAAVTDPTSMRQLRTALSDLDIQLAYDDFGAGQTRLVELVEVRPDYLKFDISLVQGIDQSREQRQQMLGTLVQMTRELGIVPLAEGIEREGEHRVCRQLGFEMAQGFFYGRPAPAALPDPSPAATLAGERILHQPLIN